MKRVCEEGVGISLSKEKRPEREVHPSERHRAFMKARHRILFLLRDFVSGQFFS
jgi:hypothetical protein